MMLCRVNVMYCHGRWWLNNSKYQKQMFPSSPTLSFSPFLFSFSLFSILYIFLFFSPLLGVRCSISPSFWLTKRICTIPICTEFKLPAIRYFSKLISLPTRNNIWYPVIRRHQRSHTMPFSTVQGSNANTLHEYDDVSMMGEMKVCNKNINLR